jgi:translocator protein
MTGQNERMAGTGQAGMIRRILELLVIAAAVFVAAYVGSAATIPNIPEWYEGLAKPFFNPPNWIFAPVWTLLYTVMTYACWRVIDKARDTPRARTASLLFAIQLFFNALWPVVFFGMHDLGLGLPAVVALDLSVYATLAYFLKLDRLSGLLLVPYAAWVSFASLLNLAIYLLNPTAS